MSDNPSAPLLADEQRAESSAGPERPASRRSKVSARSRGSDESTPLLSRDADDDHYGDAATNGVAASPATRSLHSLSDDAEGKPKGRRWPIAVALSVLTLVIIAILGLGFAMPAVIEEYAKQSMVFEPTDLSINSFTSKGVQARIRGEFMLDGSRVRRKPVRDLGRAGTWIARQVESKPSRVGVYLPEYGNILLGTAQVPGIVVDIRDGHVTPVDFLADLEPGDIDGIRQIANDWLDGRLGQLRIEGKAEVGLKSGIFNLGTQSLAESLLFEGHDLPTFPHYNITKLNFHEVGLPDSQRAMAADVALTIANDYPLTFTVPPLTFDILVPNCVPEEPYLLLADATTSDILIKARSEVDVEVQGIVRELPDTLTNACPNSETSPLDLLLGKYIHGVETKVYVRGSDRSPPDTPQWISDLIKNVVVPLPFPGHPFDDLMRDFSLADVHFDLPNPFATPNSPESEPRVSAKIQALVNLPKEMNFPIEVERIRADADVYYHKKKLGFLDLHHWQKANSTRSAAHKDEQAGLLVESIIKDAPLNITDDDVFAEVVQALVWGDKDVLLGVKANVDVETNTALGVFVVRKIPAEGRVPIKPLSGNGIDGFKPEVGSLEIAETTPTTLLMDVLVNITNPTNYSATVPYIDINILNNGTLLGHATAQNVSVIPGRNENIAVKALWDPVTPSGKHGLDVGRELLSQYISGYNTTLTLKTHNGTIPTQPRLGMALSSLHVEIPTPKLKTPDNPNRLPGDEEDRDKDAPRFIDDATMHLLTSTATFTLLSPLPLSTLYIRTINATAFYNHTEPVGDILYDIPFAIPPGATTSPRLPVDWSLGSVGYAAVKAALGGELKLDAKAHVGIRVGYWEETVWFTGKGIGASIRL